MQTQLSPKPGATPARLRALRAGARLNGIDFTDAQLVLKIEAMAPAKLAELDAFSESSVEPLRKALEDDRIANLTALKNSRTRLTELISQELAGVDSVFASISQLYATRAEMVEIARQLNARPDIAPVEALRTMLIEAIAANNLVALRQTLQERFGT